MKKLRGWKYRICTLSLLMIIGISVFPRDDARLSKTITKTYHANVGSKLELNNKYGDIIINTWSYDSIAIAITITSFGKNDEAAAKLMERTDINFSSTAGGLVVSTQLDKSDGWLRNFWNELSGYSQTIISKDQLTVDYDISLPEFVQLELSNKFGDVYVAERSATTRINISNGNLKAEDLTGEVYLNLKFCEADINSIRQSDITLKSSELNLGNAHKLTVQSSSSDIFLGSINQIRLESRTDKISINEIQTLEGRSSFSKIRLKNVLGGLDLETNYGNLTLDNIDGGFSKVLVHGKSTDINLRFDQLAYFNTRIVAKEGKFDLPDDHGLKQVYTDGTERFIRSTGHLGVYKSGPGEVNIDAQGGKVRVSFAPFNAQTTKE